MAKSPNLQLDLSLIGAGPQLRETIAANFKKVDAAVPFVIPPHAGVADNGKVLKIVAGVPTWAADAT